MVSAAIKSVRYIAVFAGFLDLTLGYSNHAEAQVHGGIAALIGSTAD